MSVESESPIWVIEFVFESRIFVTRLDNPLTFSRARQIANQTTNLETVGIEEIRILLGQQGVSAKVIEVEFYTDFATDTLRYPIS